MTEPMLIPPIPNWALRALCELDDRMQEARMKAFLATDEGKAMQARAEAAYAEDATS